MYCYISISIGLHIHIYIFTVPPFCSFAESTPSRRVRSGILPLLIFSYFSFLSIHPYYAPSSLSPGPIPPPPVSVGDARG